MEQREQQIERQIAVRRVTHVQVSWTEVEREAPEGITLHLIPDNRAYEYAVNPTVDDAAWAILRLRDRSGRMYFDLQIKEEGSG
jgi:hypothetical protein